MVLAGALCLFGAACGGDEEGGSSSSGPGGHCTGMTSEGSCDGTPCGGDIVGKWDLVTFCGPPCVSSVYETVTYGEDGSYMGGGGTWEQKDASTIVVTVGNASSAHSYCVQGDMLWTRLGTNCGPDQSTILDIVRKRDCGATNGEGGSRL